MFLLKELLNDNVSFQKNLMGGQPLKVANDVITYQLRKRTNIAIFGVARSSSMTNRVTPPLPTRQKNFIFWSYEVFELGYNGLTKLSHLWNNLVTPVDWFFFSNLNSRGYVIRATIGNIFNICSYLRSNSMTSFCIIFEKTSIPRVLALLKGAKLSVQSHKHYLHLPAALFLEHLTAQFWYPTNFYSLGIKIKTYEPLTYNHQTHIMLSILKSTRVVFEYSRWYLYMLRLRSTQLFQVSPLDEFFNI